MISVYNVFALDFNFYESANQAFRELLFPKCVLGTTDEFLTTYCMGEEL